ncbi:putative two-component sensor histidine kinase [Nostoc commune NIES-4072]|uniref:histidine kinase n=1 Tax=Nostoc commune NIES-4072 TaxID=2005467 RepID=A0A2R5FVL0_NOSCO|nr:HAMP domain-containing sensor histidine kinase [Nostoc commune]BBD70143.1 putative two-component sensor histidine kinase [Nostoc commune HK-02]GBG22796.1 putative two-component sensor histidine kinase [Nostoc commune NIES-4072]
MQKSLAQMYADSSARPSSYLLGYPDIRSMCQLQVEQLATQLPSITVWSVYNDLDRGKSRIGAGYRQEQLSSYTEISYLESELWWIDSLPSLQLSELTIASSYNAYVFPFCQQGSHPEYLLVLSYQPLLPSQQQCVEQSAQLLSHYLVIYKEYSRQKAEIQLLEQALQRSEHQTRNPLALIALYAENLRLCLHTGAEQEQAKVIHETAQKLSSDLKSLLYCGQQAKLQFTSCDLRLVLAESIQDLQPWLEQKQLRVLYPNAPITLAVDRWQLKQVFDNLLSNAVSFSPEGETISWQWQIFRNEAIFQVRDRGPGVPPEALEQVFAPFYTQRPGGTGLGLAIAKKIILDHRGSLWVDNLPEGGAQFSFTLPC